MDSESCIHQETLYEDEGPSGRRRYDSYTRKPEWISYGLLALLYVLILVLFITVCSGDKIFNARKNLVTLKEMNDFRERVHNLSSAMEDLHTSLKEKTCEDGWKQLDDSCYFLTVRKDSWEKARQLCLKKRADLAVITSEREQIFLATLSDASSNNDYWIGLHDMFKIESWLWVDGTNYKTSFKYWRWGEPEEDVYGGDPVCAYWNFYGWIETRCDLDMNGICEKKL